MANSTPQQVLEEYGDLFMKAFQASLEKHGKYVSGVLSQSIIAMPVKIMGQTLIMEIRADEYFNYVNEGVDGWNSGVGSRFKYKKSGKPIPVSAMKKFIALRGITPSLNDKRNQVIQKLRNKQLKKALKKDSKAKDLDSMAWAIGYNVKKKGIKPTHFADEVIESNLKKDMEKALSVSMGRMINVEIKKAIDGNNNK